MHYDLIIANFDLEPLFHGHWSKLRKCMHVYTAFTPNLAKLKGTLRNMNMILYM